MIPRRPRALTTIGSCLPVLVLAIAWSQMAVLPTKVPTDRFAAIDFIKSSAGPSDSVWMDENARVLTETDLLAGSRVPLTFLFSNDDDAPQRFESVLTGDFESRQARWIVLPTEWKCRAEFIRSSQAEFKWRPTRGENFVRAWERSGDLRPIQLPRDQAIRRADRLRANNRNCCRPVIETKTEPQMTQIRKSVVLIGVICEICGCLFSSI